MTKRPEIPASEYDKPMGGDALPPLDLLPDRTWLKAIIADVKYQFAIFNNKIQNITDQNENEILDEDGNPIPRKEFEIVFEFVDYALPNNKGQRKAWLRMSASKGENAHLPVFLANVLPDAIFQTPKDVIEQLKGVPVLLQLQNKPNKKDPSRPYQKVIYDAVKHSGSTMEAPQENPTPMDHRDIHGTDIPGAPPIEDLEPDDDIPF